MVYLALHKESLSRLSYHLIWGLRVDAPGATTLYQEVTWYHNNPRERQQMIANVQNMTQRKGLWGAFCWIFNWNNYRIDYYNVQAYVSWQIYEQGMSMLSATQQDAAENEGGFFVTASIGNLAIFDTLLNKGGNNLHTCLKYITAPLLWVGERALSIITDDGSFDTHDFSMGKTHFIVNEAMLDLLEVLDINAELEDALAYDDLKAAYKACCLKTHPDKPNGNAADFIKVKKAYDDLLELIKIINDPFGIQDEIDAYLQKKDAELQELHHKFKKMYELKAKYDANFDKYMASSNRFITSSKQLNQRIDEQCEEMDRQKQQIKENGRRLEKLFQQAALVKERLAGTEEQNLHSSSSTASDEEYWSDEQEQDFSDENQSPTSQAANPYRVFKTFVQNPALSHVDSATIYENKF